MALSYCVVPSHFRLKDSLSTSGTAGLVMIDSLSFVFSEHSPSYFVVSVVAKIIIKIADGFNANGKEKNQE